MSFEIGHYSFTNLSTSYSFGHLDAGHYSVEVTANSTGTRTAYGTIKADIDPLGSVTTVPEPETYALLLAGLGAMGFVARRRSAV